MVQEHKFAKKLREKQEKADAGDAAAAKYLGSQAAQSLRDYLNPDPVTGGGGVPESRGGGLGAVQAHDPVLSAGSEAAQLARENLLYQPGGKRRGNLTAADIKGINIPLVRQGLSGDDYFRFNQMLYSPNIQEYEKARPFSSGKTVRDIVRLATPAKYLGIGANWLKDKAVDAGYSILDAPSNIMDSTMVEAAKENWQDRKQGRGWKGLVEDALNMVGIGNTKKTNEFIETQTDTDGEIKTNMEDIKTHKKKTIDLHELTDLKAKRNELYNKITQGGNEPGLMAQYEQITSKILELEQGQLQDFKEGGIVSLATGGLLEKERVQQSFSPLNSAMNYGIGGLGTLFGQGGPRQHPIRPRIPHYQQPPNQDPWGIKPMGEQITGFGETLGGFGEQMTGFGEQLGGYQDALGGYGQDISSFKETVGGFGNQFENINNKLTAVEEGISSLSDKIGTTQGNTQPQGTPNFGYGFNAYSPWMFGGFGRGRYG